MPDPVGKIEPGLSTATAAEPTRGQEVALEFSRTIEVGLRAVADELDGFGS